ncbi:FtsX-like permease family protein [Thalassotalea psychrophila]|uniref:FtsX-like permease family protein n=1 Tax=Thalassotalea psychrophila TaxID=3065647 RepID=A0ABY9TWS5_9GAMM|nr:FtsX-like permease family protein [Colwelliaceae bacterium SQ149]
MAIANLALKSFRNRKVTVFLTIFSIALSVSLLIAIEKVRVQAKDSFTNTISGTDLIVGARTSSVNLLLSSVFQMGTATNGIKYESYEEIASNNTVNWSIPFSLGDSHKGYKVMGTTNDFYNHYKYGSKQSLSTLQGVWFKEITDVVIGNEVAKQLQYKIGDEIIIAHGGADSYIHHDKQPFVISGILAPTATPVDRTVFISLEGIDSLHSDQKSMAVGHDPFLTLGLPDKTNTTKKQVTDSHHSHDEHEHEHEHDTQGHDSEGHDLHEDVSHDHGIDIHSDSFVADNHHDHNHSADTITGFYLGLNERPQALTMMQVVNKYNSEPLMAIMPGVALLELWSVLSIVEKTLFAVSLMVVIISLATMLIILLNSLNQRRREMAILRAIGARPGHIFSLMMGEALAIILSGLALGIGCLYAILFFIKPFILNSFGIYLELGMPSAQEWGLLALVGGAGLIISLFPSMQIYRYALSDGMSIRS